VKLVAMSARQCSVRRYAHGEGLTHFAMSPDGKCVICWVKLPELLVIPTLKTIIVLGINVGT